MQKMQEIQVQSLSQEEPLELKKKKKGNPLPYSWLRNPMDRGAWQATVHGVAKTWTWLSGVIVEHNILAHNTDENVVT